jgi:hypothetical protein
MGEESGSQYPRLHLVQRLPSLLILDKAPSLTFYLLMGILGGLVPTGVISRILLYATRKWDGWIGKLLLIHFVTWVISLFLSAWGHADGGPLIIDQGIPVYTPAVLAWLIVDVVRLRPGVTKPNTTDNDPPATSAEPVSPAVPQAMRQEAGPSAVSADVVWMKSVWHPLRDEAPLCS